jgi:hypothetical protein
MNAAHLVLNIYKVILKIIKLAGVGSKYFPPIFNTVGHKYDAFCSSNALVGIPVLVGWNGFVPVIFRDLL